MLTRISVDKNTLEKALRSAKKAHAIYEKKLGRSDSKWPRWYAEFIIKEQQKKSLGKS